jgi:hypothetical protein
MVVWSRIEKGNWESFEEVTTETQRAQRGNGRNFHYFLGDSTGCQSSFCPNSRNYMG